MFCESRGNLAQECQRVVDMAEIRQAEECSVFASQDGGDVYVMTIYVAIVLH